MLIQDGQTHTWSASERTWFPTSLGVVFAERYASLSAAVTAIGSSVKTLQIATNQFPMGASAVTVPSTLTLDFPGNGSMLVAAGQTLTNLGDPSRYPRRLIFENCLPTHGVLTFAGNTYIRRVFPEWWGALVGGNATTNIQAFKQAIDVGVITEAAAGIYDMDNSAAALLADNGAVNFCCIRGAGMKQTMLRFTSTDHACIEILFPAAGEPSFELRDFYVRGAAWKNLTAATNANPVVFTSANHGLTNGQTGYIFGATGSWTPINGMFTITVINSNTFSIPVNSTTFGALSGSPVYAGTMANNFGIFVPGYISSTAHYISDGRIKNVQIDRTGDSGICLRGPTGPVYIENPVLNDGGNWGVEIKPDDNPTSSLSTGTQDVKICNGSMQGLLRGGISVTGVGGAGIESLTIQDCDIELAGAQTKPVVYLEQTIGADISGVTAASQVSGALAGFGSSAIELGPGAYNNVFTALDVALFNNLDGVHSQSGADGNVFIGGHYTGNSGAGGTGYVYSEAVATKNLFISPRTDNWTAGHDTVPTIAIGYKEGSFTPGVSFGGGTTGITYTNQLGRFSQNGDLVYIELRVTLSSKGSSTGAALITGMPVAGSTTTGQLAMVAFHMSPGTYTGTPFAYMQGSAATDKLQLEIQNNGTITTMDNTHFNNTTDLFITLTYRTN